MLQSGIKFDYSTSIAQNCYNMAWRYENEKGTIRKVGQKEKESKAIF
jgi:hypothetical protein